MATTKNAIMAGLVESCLMRLKRAVGLLEGQDRANNIKILGKHIKLWFLKVHEYAGKTDDTTYGKLSAMYKCVEPELKYYELILNDFLDGNSQTVINEIMYLHQSIVHEEKQVRIEPKLKFE